jgi:hypothetical protein
MTDQETQPIAKSTSWFNLRLVLACAIVIWLAWSHYRTSKLLEESERREQYLVTSERDQHEQGGLFSVGDGTKAMVGFIPTGWGHQVTWRWRVYLPPGRRFVLHSYMYPVGDSGFPPPKHRFGQIETDKLEGENFIVNVTLWRDASGEERLDVLAPRFPGTGSGSNLPMTYALHSQWFREITWHTAISGVEEPRVFAKGEPVELIRMYYDGKYPGAPADDVLKRDQGLLIWFEELEPGA